MRIEDINIRISDVTDVQDHGRYAVLGLSLHGGKWYVEDSDWGYEDMIPIEVWHGRVRVYTLKSRKGATCYSEQAVRDWLKPRFHLLTAIADGHREEWDGNNNVGVLDAAGSAAEDQLISDINQAGRRAFLSEMVAWNVADWFAECSLDELPKSGEEAAEMAKDDGVVLAGCFDSLREEREKEAAAEAAEEA